MIQTIITITQINDAQALLIMVAIMFGGLLFGLLLAKLRGRVKDYINPMLDISGILFLIAMVASLVNMWPLAAAFFWAAFMAVFFILVARTDKRETIEKQNKKMAELRDAFEAGREYQEYKGNANLEEKSWDKTFEKWYEKNYNKTKV